MARCVYRTCRAVPTVEAGSAPLLPNSVRVLAPPLFLDGMFMHGGRMLSWSRAKDREGRFFFQGLEAQRFFSPVYVALTSLYIWSL